LDCLLQSYVFTFNTTASIKLNPSSHTPVIKEILKRALSHTSICQIIPEASIV
jgi:hypothetical protein